jgi:DNA-binding HxlR family transcriptional regulator
MRKSRRSDCPISSALDLLGDRWSLLVMRDILLRGKSHYREFLASEERIATNILASRLARLEAAGLLVKTADDPRSGRQAYHATGKGKDLIPLLLEMMAWSAAHDPQAAVPPVLIAALRRDRAGTAQAIRDLGGIEAFLATAQQRAVHGDVRSWQIRPARGGRRGSRPTRWHRPRGGTGSCRPRSGCRG